jgi:hypothetical protein
MANNVEMREGHICVSPDVFYRDPNLQHESAAINLWMRKPSQIVLEITERPASMKFASS